MNFAEILGSERVCCHSAVTSKKSALWKLSELIASAEPALTPQVVFDCLVARERIGSTGLGFGVAIPHGRHATLRKAIGAFMHLEKAVDFDAQDGKAVDLLFGLLVPEECTDEHLQILAHLAATFANPEVRDTLRGCERAEDAFKMLAHGSQRS